MDSMATFLKTDFFGIIFLLTTFFSLAIVGTVGEDSEDSFKAELQAEDKPATDSVDGEEDLASRGREEDEDASATESIDGEEGLAARGKETLDEDLLAFESAVGVETVGGEITSVEVDCEQGNNVLGAIGGEETDVEALAGMDGKGGDAWEEETRTEINGDESLVEALAWKDGEEDNVLGREGINWMRLSSSDDKFK